ncbi:potassium/proton antiporter [Alkalicaulis satelles]|uniref:Potassium/proton antiporter n=1 Tax=Alkalicaulis satelles TaxID=2609175 RepID=A0A5M6ZJL2_9PROT|nr:potassium/proton antiporter [Alkalicaulis satelles]KAA5804530.1 potassium/proton antiporter [Alkalicaulis satelles]
MQTSELILLAAAGLVLLAIAGVAATRRAGAPLLLIFLALGMLAGEEGPGGFEFHDHDTAYLLGSLALALILFDGGLGTKLRRLKGVLRPAVSLATLGVIITAGITAVGAKYLFDLNWIEAFLLGAIVSSTDAAAVLMLIAGRDLKARPRVATTLEAESGFNDPMAVILVVTAVTWISQGGAPEPFGAGLSIIWALAAGGLIGWFGGRAIGWLERKVGLPIGLYPIFAAASAVFLFAFAQVIGASGFLAAYLAGVALASSPRRAADATERFSDGLAWLSQIGLFLMLGLLITPSHAAEVALPALGVALILILVARPLAVLICLAPERFRLNERAFIAWMGLRGAVPIFLGAYPVIAGVENANLYFSAAFAVVIASLVIQGWTAGPVARLFGVAPPLPRAGRWTNAGMVAAVVAGFSTVSFAVSWAVTREAPSERLITTASVAELRSALEPLRASSSAVRLESFPADWADLAPEERRETFARVAAGLITAQNARILDDRAALLAMRARIEAGEPLLLPQQARRDTLARRYGVRYEDLDMLIERVDIIPPSLGAAQAALATGWGGNESALARNALFGRFPSGQERFSSLLASAGDYVDLINTHRDFAGLRAERARLRAEGEAITGLALAAHIAPYASSGEAYAAQVASVISSAGLERFDPDAPQDAHES